MSWVLSTCLSRRFSEMHPEYPEMLILGSGWTSQFLKPVLEEEHISFVCTSTTGRSSTIPFKFNGEREQSDQDLDAFKRLPNAKTVVIMFPLRGPDCSRRLVEAYRNTHTDTQAGFVQWDNHQGDAAR